MVFIDSDGDDRRFYNMTKAVGYGCPNLGEDVKVAQFFLYRVAIKHDGYNPSGNMVIDGFVGPITRRWITEFQILCRKNGNPYMVDGIIDKAGNENNPNKKVSSISKTLYTIRALNSAMYWNDREVYTTLSTNQLVPGDVRLIFLKVQAAGPPMNF